MTDAAQPIIVGPFSTRDMAEPGFACIPHGINRSRPSFGTWDRALRGELWIAFPITTATMNRATADGRRADSKR